MKIFSLLVLSLIFSSSWSKAEVLELSLQHVEGNIYNVAIDSSFEIKSGQTIQLDSNVLNGCYYTSDHNIYFGSRNSGNFKVSTIQSDIDFNYFTVAPYIEVRAPGFQYISQLSDCTGRCLSPKRSTQNRTSISFPYSFVEGDRLEITFPEFYDTKEKLPNPRGYRHFDMPWNGSIKVDKLVIATVVCKNP